MMESELHAALVSLITLAGLLYFVLGPYNSYRLDRLRHHLFKIRDELFIEAAAGNVAFDSGAYEYTRTMLNGMIRFAHRVSLVRLFLGAALITSDEMAVMQAEHDQRLASSSQADRDVCEKFVLRTNQCLAYHFITSPAIAVLVVPLILMLLSRLAMAASKALVRRFTGRFNTLDGVFYLNGKALVQAQG